MIRPTEPAEPSRDPAGPAAGPAGADGLADLDAEDAFGHPAVPDPARDDAVWPDGDEDDLDV